MLRADVAKPPSKDRLKQTPTADLFPPPPVPAVTAAPAAELEDEAVEEGEDASAIYLTSLNYLAACGIEIPSWDDESAAAAAGGS